MAVDRKLTFFTVRHEIHRLSGYIHCCSCCVVNPWLARSHTLLSGVTWKWVLMGWFCLVFFCVIIYFFYIVGLYLFIYLFILVIIWFICVASYLRLFAALHVVFHNLVIAYVLCYLPPRRRHCNSKTHWCIFSKLLQVRAPCHGGVLYSFWYWWNVVWILYECFKYWKKFQYLKKNVGVKKKSGDNSFSFHFAFYTIFNINQKKKEILKSAP